MVGVVSAVDVGFGADETSCETTQSVEPAGKDVFQHEIKEFAGRRRLGNNFRKRRGRLRRSWRCCRYRNGGCRSCWRAWRSRPRNRHSGGILLLQQSRHALMFPECLMMPSMLRSL